MGSRANRGSRGAWDQYGKSATPKPKKKPSKEHPMRAPAGGPKQKPEKAVHDGSKKKSVARGRGATEKAPIKKWTKHMRPMELDANRPDKGIALKMDKKLRK